MCGKILGGPPKSQNRMQLRKQFNSYGLVGYFLESLHLIPHVIDLVLCVSLTSRSLTLSNVLDRT